MKNATCSVWARAAFVAATVFSLTARAATWSGAGDGSSWGDPANWGGALPGASEAVSIATGSSALTINLGATDRECAAITVTGVLYFITSCFIPETKGKSLDELENLFEKKAKN